MVKIIQVTPCSGWPSRQCRCGAWMWREYTVAPEDGVVTVVCERCAKNLGTVCDACTLGEEVVR